MKNMMAAAVLVLVGFGVAQAHVVIDDFEVGDTTLVTIGGGSETNIETAAGVIGIEREVELISSGGISSTSIDLMDNGKYIQGNNDGASMGLLTYDGIGSAGLGGVDLTEGGSLDKLIFRGLSIDTGTADVSVTINGTTVALPTISGSSSGNYTIDLSLFGGEQFTADEILVDFNLGTNTDLTLEAIVTGTPEPVTLAIWSILGCCGFGFAKFRRRRSAA